LALADKGIRVNAVAPGTIATELAAKAVLTSDDAKAKIMSRTPMKRLGEPSEIADVVAWLVSDAASYVTGEVVTVDGGRMALNYTVAVWEPFCLFNPFATSCRRVAWLNRLREVPHEHGVQMPGHRPEKLATPRLPLTWIMDARR